MSMEGPPKMSMEGPNEPSSSSSSAKPVVVRVKRKSNQERLDAFWLEINERPPKRQFLDIEGLSISDSSAKVITEATTKKLLVQHVETVNVSEAAKDVLQSYLPNLGGSKYMKRKIEEHRSMLKQEKKQEHLRSTARQRHEDQVRSARFEQIWKSRKDVMEAGEDNLHELCHLYDVVQVDVDKKNSGKVQKQESVSVEDKAILCNYLPLLREYIAEAAEEIESDMKSYAFGEGSMDDGMNEEQSTKIDYVYDLYTVEDDPNGTKDEEARVAYPLVQVYEEYFYDGPSGSDYETDDSNAEDNPLNDYPDEEPSEDEKDEEDPSDYYDGRDSQYEDEVVDASDREDEEDWRWRHC